MRLILLHNPTAGDEDHSRDQLVSLLKQAGHDVLYRSLADEGWADALREDGDLIVVAGGDGSVRKVFTALEGSPITTTLLPMGSANNIARTLGFGTDDAAQLVAGWEPAKRKSYNLWEVEAGSRHARFVESFGGGVFGEVLVRAEGERSPSGDDKVDRGLELMCEVLGGATPQRWELDVDGERLREELLGVEVMNIRELGPNLRVAPDADPGDGRLDLALIRPDDRAGLIAYAEAKLEGDVDAEPPHLQVLRLEELRAMPADACPLHVDDQLVEDEAPAPVRVRRVAVEIEVLVPLFAPE